MFECKCREDLLIRAAIECNLVCVDTVVALGSKHSNATRPGTVMCVVVGNRVAVGTMGCHMHTLALLSSGCVRVHVQATQLHMPLLPRGTCLNKP